MSFELICHSCGAASGPSVGICPFCKSVLTHEGSKNSSPALRRLRTLFEEGKLEQAALLAREAIKSQNEKLSGNPEVLLICAQILFEIEAPLAELKSILAKASLLDPEHLGIQELLSLVEAKSAFNFRNNTEGKKLIEAILRKAPQNPHALFLLATYVNSRENNPTLAIVYLEKALQSRPSYLRAWACLASIAAQVGNTHVAEKALLKAMNLETNSQMKAFFSKLLLEVRYQSQKAA